MTMRASALKAPKRAKDRPLDIRALRAKTTFSQEQLARALGMSCWERQIAHPSQEVEARLKRLIELVARIGDALPESEVPKFLQTPQPLLRGYRPIDLLSNDYSFQDLLAFVESARSGDMA
jgi:DNA-binding transcriptional regulator YiaG